MPAIASRMRLAIPAATPVVIPAAVEGAAVFALPAARPRHSLADCTAARNTAATPVVAAIPAAIQDVALMLLVTPAAVAKPPVTLAAVAKPPVTPVAVAKVVVPTVAVPMVHAERAVVVD
jgi:hypothetical protein